jgi:hypothetical protein
LGKGELKLSHDQSGKQHEGHESHAATAATPLPEPQDTAVTRGELEVKLSEVRAKAAQDHIVIRSEALRIGGYHGLCESGIRKFVENLGMPWEGRDYDGRLAAAWANKVALAGVDPAMLSDAGLQAALQAETSAHEEWLAAMRKKVIETVNNGNIRAEDVTGTFAAVGIPALEQATCRTVSFGLSWHEPLTKASAKDVVLAAAIAARNAVVAGSPDTAVVKSITADEPHVDSFTAYV